MYFLPQSCELLKVKRRGIQNFLHIRPLGVSGSDGVVPFRQSNRPFQPKIHNRLCIADEAVHMTRRMIV